MCFSHTIRTRFWLRLASLFVSDSQAPIHMQVIQGLLSNDGKTGLLDSLILQRKLQTVQALPFALNDIDFFVILILPQIAFSDK